MGPLTLQIADNRTTSYQVSITGISLLLQLKQIASSMPISGMSSLREAYCHKKSENQFPRKMKENF
jgi:hypothetical protein